MSHTERARRGRRRGASRDGCSSGGGPRASEQQQQPQPQPLQQWPGCTLYDMACFEAYAHTGIHEEMIKTRTNMEATVFTLALEGLKVVKSEQGEL